MHVPNLCIIIIWTKIRNAFIKMRFKVPSHNVKYNSSQHVLFFIACSIYLRLYSMLYSKTCLMQP